MARPPCSALRRKSRPLRRPKSRGAAVDEEDVGLGRPLEPEGVEARVHVGHLVPRVGALVVLRVLHAWGLARNPGANYPRLIGAQGTFVLMSVLGMTAVVLALR